MDTDTKVDADTKVDTEPCNKEIILRPTFKMHYTKSYMNSRHSLYDDVKKELTVHDSHNSILVHKFDDYSIYYDSSSRTITLSYSMRDSKKIVLPIHIDSPYLWYIEPSKVYLTYIQNGDLYLCEPDFQNPESEFTKWASEKIFSPSDKVLNDRIILLDKNNIMYLKIMGKRSLTYAYKYEISSKKTELITVGVINFLIKLDNDHIYIVHFDSRYSEDIVYNWVKNIFIKNPLHSIKGIVRGRFLVGRESNSKKSNLVIYDSITEKKYTIELFDCFSGENSYIDIRDIKDSTFFILEETVRLGYIYTTTAYLIPYDNVIN